MEKTYTEVVRETHSPYDPNTSRETVSDTKAVKRPVVNYNAEIGEPKNGRKKNKKVWVLFSIYSNILTYIFKSLNLCVRCPIL